MARHGSLAGRVSATGTLNASDLSAHIAACDVLLQPYPDGVTSRRTTAMAGLFARVPVVTTQGKLTERFWQEGAVKLADVGDVNGIVRHVLQLLADSRQSGGVKPMPGARSTIAGSTCGIRCRTRRVT